MPTISLEVNLEPWTSEPPYVLNTSDPVNALMALSLFALQEHSLEDVLGFVQRAAAFKEKMANMPVETTPFPTDWTRRVPMAAGEYQWRDSEGAKIHNFTVGIISYKGIVLDTFKRCYTLTDFDFIDEGKGEWRWVSPA